MKKPGTKPGSGEREQQIIKALSVSPATKNELERIIGTRSSIIAKALDRLRRARIVGITADTLRHGLRGPAARKWRLLLEADAAAARVEKEIAPVPLVDVKERVDWHLENWAGWMHARDTHQDFPPKSPGLMGGGGESVETFEIMCDSEDTKCAEIVDSIIDGLPIHERMALEHVHLAAVFRYKRMDMETVYLTARRHVAWTLRARGVY